MRKPKQPFRHGDVFSIPLPNGQYLFGRVVFDVAKQTRKPGITVSPDNYFIFLGSSILIDVYRDLQSVETIDCSEEVLIPGVFTSTTLLGSGVWHVLGNRPVDPTQVQFPEVFINSDSTTYFERGELFLLTQLTWNEYEALPFRASINSPYGVGAMGLNYLGRRDLIEEKYLYPKYLEDIDLRYKPQRRAAIYEQLQEDPTEPYYQMALRHGFDLARFY
jgi:hypothetical protein